MTDTPWLEWRQQGIGASDVAKAHTGIYGGEFAVIADKLGHPTNDHPDPNILERGRRWERPLADAVHALTGYYVHGEQAQIEHTDNPLWRCTLDGCVDPQPQIPHLLAAEAVLELKTIGTHGRWQDAYWESQCQWQMHVTGIQRALLVVARIDDTDDTCSGVPRIQWIDYDRYHVADLVLTAERIWAHVQAGTFPPPDEHTPTSLVREINRDAEPVTNPRGREIPNPDLDITDLEPHLDRYLTVLAALKPLQEEREHLERLFRHHMGKATLAETERWRLRVGTPVAKFTSDSEADALEVYPQYGRMVLDRARFKAEEPDLYEAFKRPTTDRRITVKEKRNNQ